MLHAALVGMFGLNSCAPLQRKSRVVKLYTKESEESLLDDIYNNTRHLSIKLAFIANS